MHYHKRPSISKPRVLLFLFAKERDVSKIGISIPVIPFLKKMLCMKEIIMAQEGERGITSELVSRLYITTGFWFPKDPQLATSYLPAPEEHLGRYSTVVYY